MSVSSASSFWHGPAYVFARRWIAGRVAAGEKPPAAIVCRGCGGYL